MEPVKPGPGQESVWDYPRPPAVEFTNSHIEVVLGGRLIADTTRAFRVLETGHPPVYYIPFEDVAEGVLVPGDRVTYREFRGEARFFHVSVPGLEAFEAAKMIIAPGPGYESLDGYVAFFARAMDECRVDGEVVTPQPGPYYAGWITSKVVGPFDSGGGADDR
ncbi:MAG: DUF427 domain-containing protein [Actinobacteria bacterium]|nr:DUF427 domain-containing protein [Actinomycetota bacterium]